MNSYQKMLNSPVSPDVVTFNTMINVYVKTQRLEDAFALFLQMKSQGIEPTIVTYTSLIDGCGKCGNFTMALSLYNDVKDSRLELNMHLFNAVMNAGLINGHVFVIDEVMKEISAQKLKPNTITFNTLLSGYLRFDQLYKMKSVVEQMKSIGVEFSAVTQTTVLQAIQLVHTAADLDEFFHLLVIAGLTPSQVQGSQAVKDLIQLGRLHLAQRLMIRLMSSGCSLTEEVFLAIISLAGDCANFGVLQWAAEFRFNLRNAIFFAQMNALARLDDVERVGELYEQSRGGPPMPPNVRIGVFQCFLNAGDERAFDLLDQFVSGPVSPESLEKVVQALFQLEMFERIVTVFQVVQYQVGTFLQLASDCIISALLRCNSELKSLAKLSPSLTSIIAITKSRQKFAATILVEKMLEVKTPPAGADFLDLLNAIAGCDPQTLWACFRHFVGIGAVVSEAIVDLMAGHVDSFECHDELSFLVNAARDAGVKISAPLYSTVLGAALEAGNLGDALALHEEMETAHLKATQEVEQRYTDIFTEVRDAFPAARPTSTRIRTRARSRTNPTGGRPRIFD
jgi:pentatricopeptide repeat protein